MTETAPRRPTATRPFEGSAQAAAFIARVRRFIDEELQPLASRHGLSLEQAGDRELLRQVWKRTWKLSPLTGQSGRRSWKLTCETPAHSTTPSAEAASVGTGWSKAAPMTTAARRRKLGCMVGPRVE